MKPVEKNAWPGVLAGLLLAFLGAGANAEPSCFACASPQRLSCELDLRDYFFTSDAKCVYEANADSARFDNAGAGMLLPFDPQPGDVIRQEVSYGKAEDVIRIESVTEPNFSNGASCNGDCLLTTDDALLYPGVEEKKFYLPGIGRIVEIDLETGDRVELEEFSNVL